MLRPATWECPRCGYEVRRPATQRMLDALAACIEHTTEARAAVALGIAEQTVKNLLSELYARIGARSRPHAAWLLFDRYGDGWRLPGEDTAPEASESSIMVATAEGTDEGRAP